MPTFSIRYISDSDRSSHEYRVKAATRYSAELYFVSVEATGQLGNVTITDIIQVSG